MFPSEQVQVQCGAYNSKGPHARALALVVCTEKVPANSLIAQIYTAVVLMWTYGNSKLWPQLTSEAIDTAKHIIIFVLIYRGTGSFQRILVSAGPEVENLVRALGALSTLFGRLWFMLFVSATLTMGVALGFSTRG